MSKDIEQDVNVGREQEVGSLANTDVIMRNFKYLKNQHCSCDQQGVKTSGCKLHRVPLTITTPLMKHYYLQKNLIISVNQ